MNWIIETGQVWKLYVALTGLIGAVVLFTVAFVSLGATDGQFAAYAASGTVLALATFLWFVAALRCPHCAAKLVWIMVASRPHTSWMIDLAALEQCPVCGRSLRQRSSP